MMDETSAMEKELDLLRKYVPHGLSLHDFDLLRKQNATLHSSMFSLMARLADLLDEDKFRDCEDIVRQAGVTPPEPAAWQYRERFRASLDGERQWAEWGGWRSSDTRMPDVDADHMKREVRPLYALY